MGGGHGVFFHTKNVGFATGTEQPGWNLYDNFISSVLRILKESVSKFIIKYLKIFKFYLKLEVQGPSGPQLLV